MGGGDGGVYISVVKLSVRGIKSLQYTTQMMIQDIRLSITHGIVGRLHKAGFEPTTSGHVPILICCKQVFYRII